MSLHPGRCLGLVGRRGRQVHTGVHPQRIVPPDAGAVCFHGQPAPSLGDVTAWRARIATVFQHSMVVPGLTVAGNVFLGRHRAAAPAPSAWSMARMRQQAGSIVADWGFDVDADAPCASLTVEQRQVVEITRALASRTRCLLLDEPTAALERRAVQRLFDRVRQLREAGVAIMYISHHLEEVFEICTDVAVLRGRRAGARRADDRGGPGGPGHRDGRKSRTARASRPRRSRLFGAAGSSPEPAGPAAAFHPAVRATRPEAGTRPGGQHGRLDDAGTPLTASR